MPRSRSKLRERPRELRRRVLLPARLRAGAHWSDTCIINISSRGLLIHSSRPANQGSTIEVRRGPHVITARVAWRDGARIGLQSEDPLLVEDIISLGQSQAFRLTAVGARRGQACALPETASDARLRSRMIEFIAAGLAAASLAAIGWAMTEQALARPMDLVALALDGHAGAADSR